MPFRFKSLRWARKSGTRAPSVEVMNSGAPRTGSDRNRLSFRARPRSRRWPVHPVDGGRRDDAGERVEVFRVATTGAETRHHADAGQVERTDRLPLAIDDLDLARGVLQVTQEDLVAGEAGRTERLGGFGNDGAPVLPARLRHVDRDDAAERRLVVRLHVEERAVVPQHVVAGREFVDDLASGPISSP
jgi:hypothetical protein